MRGGAFSRSGPVSDRRVTLLMSGRGTCLRDDDENFVRVLCIAFAWRLVGGTGGSGGVWDGETTQCIKNMHASLAFFSLSNWLESRLCGINFSN